MQILNDTGVSVNPHVAVVEEGCIYRWSRFDGRTRRTSNEAFTTLGDAVKAAVVVAACYDVPVTAFTARRDGAVSNVSWNSSLLTDHDDYVPFQHPAEAYADVRMAEDREDWVGD